MEGKNMRVLVQTIMLLLTVALVLGQPGINTPQIPQIPPADGLVPPAIPGSAQLPPGAGLLPPIMPGDGVVPSLIPGGGIISPFIPGIGSIDLPKLKCVDSVLSIA